MAKECKPVFLIFVFVGMFVLCLVFAIGSKSATEKDTTKNILETSKNRSNNEHDSGNKWTILITVNDGYFDFFQNWLHYYRKLNLDYRMIILAEDGIVYHRLKQINMKFTTIVRSERSSISDAGLFGTQPFNNLVSGRPSYILRYIKKGLDIVNTDIDIVWLQNPVPYFRGDFDIWIKSDGGKTLCTGLMAIKSNNATIQLFKKQEMSLQKELLNEQVVFNKVINWNEVRVKPLDMRIFPTGQMYFREFTAIQRTNAVVVHTNWMAGHSTKMNHFKKFGLWFS